MNLGTRLASLRKKKGIKQEEAAKLLGVARTTYAMYEQGRRHPDTKTLERISMVFEVSADYLISGTTLAEQVKAARSKKGLSVAELGKLVGLTSSEIQRIEDDDNGDSVQWDPWYLSRLATALSDDPTTFLLRTSQRWRFRALEYIDHNDRVRDAAPQYGGGLAAEELTFVQCVHDQVSASFFHDFFDSSDKEEWIRSLRFVHKMMRERDLELELAKGTDDEE